MYDEGEEWEQVQERFYRHQNPSKGFQLCNEFQLPTKHREFLVAVILQLNECYQDCAKRHQECFLVQPRDGEILCSIIAALCLPISVAVIIDAYGYLLLWYLIALTFVAWKVRKYCRKSQQCKIGFEKASRNLKQQFFSIKETFEQMIALLTKFSIAGIFAMLPSMNDQDYSRPRLWKAVQTVKNSKEKSIKDNQNNTNLPPSGQSNYMAHQDTSKDFKAESFSLLPPSRDAQQLKRNKHTNFQFFHPQHGQNLTNTDKWNQPLHQQGLNVSFKPLDKVQADTETQTGPYTAGLKPIGPKNSLSEHNSMQSFREQVGNQFAALFGSRSIEASIKEEDSQIKTENLLNRWQVKQMIKNIFQDVRNLLSEIKICIKEYEAGMSYLISHFPANLLEKLKNKPTPLSLTKTPESFTQPKRVLDTSNFSEVERDLQQQLYYELTLEKEGIRLRQQQYRGKLEEQMDQTFELHTVIDRLRDEMAKMHDRLLEEENIVYQKIKENQDLQQQIKALRSNFVPASRDDEYKVVSKKYSNPKCRDNKGARVTFTESRQFQPIDRCQTNLKLIGKDFLQGKGRYFQRKKSTTSGSKSHETSWGSSKKRLRAYLQPHPKPYDYVYGQTERIISDHRSRKLIGYPSQVLNQQRRQGENQNASIQPAFRDRMRHHMDRIRHELGQQAKGRSRTLMEECDKVIPKLDWNNRESFVLDIQSRPNINNNNLSLDSKYHKLSQKLKTVKYEIESDLNRMKQSLQRHNYHFI